MVKKQSESSRPAKPIRVNAESVWSKPLTKRQKAVLDGVAMSQSRGSDAHIDYSAIPALSEKQLAQFKRAPKKLVAVRLDADVFEWIRQFGPGYSTRINNVLRVVMAASQLPPAKSRNRNSKRIEHPRQQSLRPLPPEATQQFVVVGK